MRGKFQKSRVNTHVDCQLIWAGSHIQRAGDYQEDFFSGCFSAWHWAVASHQRIGSYTGQSVRKYMLSVGFRCGCSSLMAISSMSTAASWLSEHISSKIWTRKWVCVQKLKDTFQEHWGLHAQEILTVDVLMQSLRSLLDCCYATCLSKICSSVGWGRGGSRGDLSSLDMSVGESYSQSSPLIPQCLGEKHQGSSVVTCSPDAISNSIYSTIQHHSSGSDHRGRC